MPHLVNEWLWSPCLICPVIGPIQQRQNKQPQATNHTGSLDIWCEPAQAYEAVPEAGYERGFHKARAVGDGGTGASAATGYEKVRSSDVFSRQLHNDGPHTLHCWNVTANPSQAISDEQVPTPPVAPISLQHLATDGSFAAVLEVHEHVEIPTCNSEMLVANQDAPTVIWVILKNEATLQSFMRFYEAAT